MDNITIFGGSFTHDEKNLLIGNNESGIINAYTIPVDGGKMEKLTNSEETVRPMSFFPKDNRLLYLSDKGGNEKYHIYLRNEDGSIKELTPGDESRAVFYGWAHDLNSFFIGWNKRDPRFMDVYEIDLEEFSPDLMYQNDGGYNFGGISKDKSTMALSKAINTNDSNIFIYDFKTKKLTQLNESKAFHQPADFSKDNQELYYLTDDNSEFKYLKKYNLETGKHEKVMEADWDINYAYFSRNGKYRVVGINQDGKTVVQITNKESGKPVDFPKF